MTVIRWKSRPSCLCCFYIWKEKKERRKSNSSKASLHTMFVTVLGSIFIYQLVRPLFKVPVLSPVYWHPFFLWTVWSWQNFPLTPSFLFFTSITSLSLYNSLVLNYLFSLHRPRPRSPNVFFSPSPFSCLDIFIFRSQKVEWTLVEPVGSAHTASTSPGNVLVGTEKAATKILILQHFSSFHVSQLVKIRDSETLYVINSYWLTVI